MSEPAPGTKEGTAQGDALPPPTTTARPLDCGGAGFLLTRGAWDWDLGALASAAEDRARLR